MNIGDKVEIRGYDGPDADGWNGRRGVVYDIDNGDEFVGLRGHAFVEFTDTDYVQRGGFKKQFVVPEGTPHDDVVGNLRAAVRRARTAGYTVDCTVSYPSVNL